MMCIRAGNVFALMFAVCVLAACAKPSVIADSTPPAEVVLDHSYVLGPGEELNIVVVRLHIGKEKAQAHRTSISRKLRYESPSERERE